MFDGRLYFWVVKIIVVDGFGYLGLYKNFVVGLGCDFVYVYKFVYFIGVVLDDLSMEVLIGVGCKICN